MDPRDHKGWALNRSFNTQRLTKAAHQGGFSCSERSVEDNDVPRLKGSAQHGTEI